MAETNPIRLQIIQRARELFFERGFSKVTTDEIAASLGISKKTLYQHFESKEDLLRGVSYAMRDEIAGGIERIVDDPELDFAEKLRKVMMHLGSKVSQMRRPFFEDLRNKAPELWRELEAFRRERILTVFDRLITEGSRHGMLRKEVDPHLFVMMFYAVIQQVFNPEVLSQLPLTPAEAFRTFITVMMEGVLTDEAKRKFGGEK